MRDTYVRVQKILPPKARDEMTDEEFDAVMERGMGLKLPVPAWFCHQM